MILDSSIFGDITLKQTIKKNEKLTLDSDFKLSAFVFMKGKICIACTIFVTKIKHKKPSSKIFRIVAIFDRLVRFVRRVFIMLLIMHTLASLSSESEVPSIKNHLLVHLVQDDS